MLFEVTTVGKNSLEEMEKPAESTKGYSLKSDRKISIHFLGRPFNITVIQVYAPTSNAEEAERIYEDLQNLELLKLK